MRTINQSILDELAAQELRPFILIHMDIDGTDYRYTDCDVALVSGGNRFDPHPFSLEPVRYSIGHVVDLAKCSFSNLGDTFTAEFVGGDPRGSDVTFQFVALDADYQIIVGALTFFMGEIDGWSLDEEALPIIVSNQFSQWSQRTLSRQSASCRWKKFKGDDADSPCMYAGGESWCDRTYARCTALSNTANFGGQRWLPSIMDREIWWGRTQAGVEGSP